MSLLTNVADKRHFPVPTGHELILKSKSHPGETRVLRTLDDLSQVLSEIQPEDFTTHVSRDMICGEPLSEEMPDRNDFADWVKQAFGEVELAQAMRGFPTALRMLVTVERFLSAKPFAASPRKDSGLEDLDFSG